jgi:hypothetical protein
MKITIAMTCPRRHQRKTGLTEAMGFTGANHSSGVISTWGSKLAQEVIDSRASELAGPAFSPASGEVGECGARSEASAAQRKPLRDERDLADDPPGITRMVLTVC